MYVLLRGLYRELMAKRIMRDLFIRMMMGLKIPCVYMHDGLLYPIHWLGSKTILWRLLRLGKGEVVVDCGAYIGRLSIKAARSVGVEGKVISIEPDPETFRILLKNISLNNVADRVIPINVALSDDEGPVKLYLTGYPATHSIVWKRDSFIEVPARKLDNLAEELKLNTIHWLIIDAEGAEVRRS